MLKSLAILALTAFSLNGLAEGFKCRALQHSLTVRVFGSDTTPATREAQIMVVSDPRVSPGRQTIARFTRENGTLQNRGVTFIGNVDLRFNDTGRAGENIGGTKLGELDQIILAVDFTYLEPAQLGEPRDGILTLLKRNGTAIEIGMVCSRFH